MRSQRITTRKLKDTWVHMRLSCGLTLNVELFSCLIVFYVDPATRPGIQAQPSPKDTLMHEVTLYCRVIGRF